MSSTTQPETIQVTLSLSGVVARHIREQVATGLYANETDYIESKLLSEALFEPIDERELTHWINTEGVRRLHAMEADPNRFLTEAEAFDFLEALPEDEGGAA